MATDPPTNPTTDDLREIADFIRQRSLDEAGAAGVMDFYRKNGVTIHGRFPEGAFGRGADDADRVKVAAWLDSHTPDRFTGMAHELAGLAGSLVDALFEVPEAFKPYQARSMWRRLTGAARLWRDHPDFQPRWADGTDASDD